MINNTFKTDCKVTPMPGGVTEVNYFIRIPLGIILMQRAMIQTSLIYYAHSCDVINTRPWLCLAA